MKLLLDRSIDDYLSQVTKSSVDVNIGSMRSVNSDEKRIPLRKNKDVVLEKCLSNSFDDRISKWVYSSVDEEVDVDSFCKLCCLNRLLLVDSFF